MSHTSKTKKKRYDSLKKKYSNLKEKYRKLTPIKKKLLEGGIPTSVLISLLATTLFPYISEYIYHYPFASGVTIYGYGIEVYWDIEATNITTSIDWGNVTIVTGYVYVGNNTWLKNNFTITNTTVYIKNIEDLTLYSLGIRTENVLLSNDTISPLQIANASDYIMFDINWNNTIPLLTGEIREATLSLIIHSNVSEYNVTSFSADIYLDGTFDF